MISLVQPSDFFDHDMDSGAYPGPPICGIPGMMCWGVEGIGCQGCLREGEEDENGWRIFNARGRFRARQYRQGYLIL